MMTNKRAGGIVTRYDRAHMERVVKYQRRVKRIMDAAVREAARLGVSLDASPGDDRLFSFADYPTARRQFDALMREVAADVNVAIVDGIRAEWTLANSKNNELANVVFGSAVGKLPQSAYRRYFSTNGAARDVFVTRQREGLSLSDRVWRYTDQFKQEIELALDLGIRGGVAADRMTDYVRDYLRHPDKLFRRVRDEHGRLHLSQAAAAFHPGRGVYRSSYRNALRLTGTETNIAYRTADHLRWQQEDFVVGIEIELSNNHTCLGTDGKAHEFADICDELKGRYPKEFKFTGWHPNCRCHAVPILKSDAEQSADIDRILAGDAPLPAGDSVNAVTDVPDGFKAWVASNGDRLGERAPYFVRDNRGLVDAIAREGIDEDPRYGAMGSVKLGRQQNKIAWNIYESSVPLILSDTLQQNIDDAAQLLNTTITPMNFIEADSGNSNIIRSMINCQCCVAVHEARLRGLNVTAVDYSTDPNSAQYRLAEKFQSIWINPKTGTIPEVTVISSDKGDIMPRFEKSTQAIGRYHIGINAHDGSGHVLTAERFSDGKMIFYDPQCDEFVSLSNVEDYASLEVLKIDKLLFNTNMLAQISTLVH